MTDELERIWKEEVLLPDQGIILPEFALRDSGKPQIASARAASVLANISVTSRPTYLVVHCDTQCQLFSESVTADRHVETVQRCFILENCCIKP
jgi:hypothetical protein